jgi:hypothetical protein
MPFANFKVPAGTQVLTLARLQGANRGSADGGDGDGDG